MKLKPLCYTMWAGICMWALAIALFVTCSGCMQYPRRVVIEDDPELVDTVMGAVDDLEEYMPKGCEIWDLRVGGKRRDWRGFLPPRGTITIEVNARRTGSGYSGREYTGPIMPRSRIYLKTAKVRPSVVIHELLHAMGEEHQKKGIMAAGGYTGNVAIDMDESTDEFRDRIGRLCRD